MYRIALGINYDGAKFQGWQKQPHGKTIQDIMELALARVLNQEERIKLSCAGRTDSGVHAGIQVAHFDTIIRRPERSWVSGLNAFLPEEISVRWAKHVPCDFHARFSARSRTYMYLLYCGTSKPALWNKKVGWSFKFLDIIRIREAISFLIGEKDFRSFRSSQCQAKNPVRIIYTFEVEKREPFIIFTICANAFLHHMVRNLLGALIYLNLRNEKSSEILKILNLGYRLHGFPTISPHGLYLAAIDYPSRFKLLGLDSRNELLSLISRKNF